MKETGSSEEIRERHQTEMEGPETMCDSRQVRESKKGLLLPTPPLPMVNNHLIAVLSV